MRFVEIDMHYLTIDRLNELIDRGERFNVRTGNEPTAADEELWHTNHAFWSEGDAGTQRDASQAQRHLES